MIIAIYLTFINLYAFIVYGIDKRKAIKNGKKESERVPSVSAVRRIPEATLILLAVIGGAIGAFLGMMVFRHKTQKKKFTRTVPLRYNTWILTRPLRSMDKGSNHIMGESRSVQGSPFRYNPLEGRKVDRQA